MSALPLSLFSPSPPALPLSAIPLSSPLSLSLSLSLSPSHPLSCHSDLLTLLATHTGNRGRLISCQWIWPRYPVWLLTLERNSFTPSPNKDWDPLSTGTGDPYTFFFQPAFSSSPWGHNSHSSSTGGREQTASQDPSSQDPTCQRPKDIIMQSMELQQGDPSLFNPFYHELNGF